MIAVPHYPPKARARHNHHQEEKGQEQFFKTAEREIDVEIGKEYCEKSTEQKENSNQEKHLK